MARDLARIEDDRKDASNAPTVWTHHQVTKRLVSPSIKDEQSSKPTVDGLRRKRLRISYGLVTNDVSIMLFSDPLNPNRSENEDILPGTPVRTRPLFSRRG